MDARRDEINSRIGEYKSKIAELKQEQLTSAIHGAVDKITEGNLGVAVTIVATHNCVSCRGVKHQGAAMVTTKATGVFRDNTSNARKEFFDSLKINNGGHQI